MRSPCDAQAPRDSSDESSKYNSLSLLSLSRARVPAPEGPLELEFVGLALQIATIVESFCFRMGT